MASSRNYMHWARLVCFILMSCNGIHGFSIDSGDTGSSLNSSAFTLGCSSMRSVVSPIEGDGSMDNGHPLCSASALRMVSREFSLCGAL